MIFIADRPRQPLAKLAKKSTAFYLLLQVLILEGVECPFQILREIDQLEPLRQREFCHSNVITRHGSYFCDYRGLVRCQIEVGNAGRVCAHSSCYAFSRRATHLLRPVHLWTL